MMLGLAVSGVLLFGNGFNLEQSQQEIDDLDINPLNPQYIKLLTKQLIETNQIVGLNAKSVLSNAGIIKNHDSEIERIKRQVKQLQRELNQLKQAKH